MGGGPYFLPVLKRGSDCISGFCSWTPPSLPIERKCNFHDAREQIRRENTKGRIKKQILSALFTNEIREVAHPRETAGALEEARADQVLRADTSTLRGIIRNKGKEARRRLLQRRSSRRVLFGFPSVSLYSGVCHPSYKRPHSWK